MKNNLCLKMALPALFVVLSVSPAFALSDSENAPASFASAATPLSPEQVHSVLEQAKTSAGLGDLIQARTQLESLSSGEEQDQATKDAIRTELEAINFQILLSAEIEEDALIHTIEKGDNLYNLAKKHKTTVDLIKRINKLEKDVIRPGKKLKIITTPFHAVVDKSDNTLQLFLGDRPIKTYQVATGTDNSTPIGTFKITNKLEKPTWYTTGAVHPPESPENILGSRWLGFSLKSYGIHGTTEPETIGQQVSHGCIRMRNEEVEELYSFLPVGAEVTVQD